MVTVCEGAEIVFVCQLPSSPSGWVINLIGRSRLLSSAAASQAGMILTFSGDPGYGFEIRVLNSSQAGFFSELRVTAVTELNQVTVECQGISRSFMSTINIVSVPSRSECELNSN